MTGNIAEQNDCDDIVREIPGVVCIDAKTIYDCLINRTNPHGLLEKRKALELMADLKNTRRNGTATRWIHGEANPADGRRDYDFWSRAATSTRRRRRCWRSTAR